MLDKPKKKEYSNPKPTQKAYMSLMVKYRDGWLIPKKSDTQHILKLHGYQNHGSIIANMNTNLVEKNMITKVKHSRYRITEKAMEKYK